MTLEEIELRGHYQTPKTSGFYWYNPGNGWQVVQVDGKGFWYLKSSIGCLVKDATGIWGPKVEKPTKRTCTN